MLSHGVGYIGCLLLEAFLQLHLFTAFQEACQGKTCQVLLRFWRMHRSCLWQALFRFPACLQEASVRWWLSSEVLQLHWSGFRSLQPGAGHWYQGSFNSCTPVWAQGGAEDGSCELTWKGNAGCSPLIHLPCHRCGFGAFLSLAPFNTVPVSRVPVCSLSILLIIFQEVIKIKSERKTHLLGEDRLLKCQEKTSSICTAIKAKT